MSSKTLRSLAVLASAAMVLGAFVAPADAKKKKKKKAVPVCAPYTSPEWAGEAETTTITDEATAEKPIEVELSTAPGAGFTSADEPNGGDGETTSVFHNVVVDSAAASAPLSVRIEYAPVWDYDLFLRTAEGPALAYEADFNPATVGGPTPVGGNEGAHPEVGAGQIDAFEAADCSGYTIDVASAISAGGAVTMTLWLGE